MIGGVLKKIIKSLEQLVPMICRILKFSLAMWLFPDCIVPTAFPVNVAGKLPQQDPVRIYHQIKKTSKKRIMLK